MVNSVLVVGGGIVGTQAALDLADMGFTVYLVDKSPSLGGRMAQLDKTFPTNDCSICILAPKMVDCYQHPNVEALLYSEVVRVEGGLGDFRVSVLRKPTYVDWEKCTGCGECMEKCPTRVLNEFNMGLDKRKAIYVPFLQAVPKKATIDEKACVFLTRGKCGICKKTCNADAINFEQEKRVVELKVGAIIIATGYEFYDVSKIQEYNYGKIENVVTAMEFERLICASGPTAGHLERPSDKKTPEKIAFIQCVGSRDFNHNPYCSGVCCMHSVKEAILANEHHPEVESTIFFIDMRATGKKFQEYVERARKEYKVSLVRGRPSRLTQDPETKNVWVWYEDTSTRRVKKESFDMVVLAQSLVPSRENKKLAELIGISLDKYGFIKIPDRVKQPVDTEKKGVFAVGYCQTPLDIPEGVAQASSAAARVAELLACHT
ncbi:MAG: hypothetical protein DRO11_07240 [Methanobacteriota archaeon]|nr:MAG: hypothetical protein DRO11_07240 [Euryarchaeota archaeon]